MPHIIGFFCAVLSLVGPSCASTPDLTPLDDDAPTLTVVSYNVNYGLAGDRSVLDAIAMTDADVVLLQETNEGWERAITKRFKQRYPHRRFTHEPAAGGLAILSKNRIVDEERLPAVTWFPAWRGVVKTPLGPVEFLNVHLRPPFDDDGSVVKGWFTTPAMRADEITAFADALSGEHPVVVVGDMNEGSGPALSTLRARGLDDALDRVPGVKTWSWPIGPVAITGRYDHVFVDEDLAIVDAWVLDRGASDHLPVVAVVQRRR